jgi:hypothetical protein
MKRYVVLFAGLLLTACYDNAYKTAALDSHFGQSIKQTTEAQYLNPQAAAHPPLDTPKRLDGQVGQNVMSNYRQERAESESVQEVTINVGGGSGGSGQ